MSTETSIYNQTPISILHPRSRIEWMIFRYADQWMAFLLIFSDLISLYLAGWIAFRLRVSMGGILNPQQYIPLLFTSILFIVVFNWRNLYRPIGMGADDELRRMLISNTVVFLLLSSISFLVKSPAIFSRLMFAFAWFFSCAILPLTRMLVRYLAARFNLWGSPAAIVFSESTTIPYQKMKTIWAEQNTHGLKPVIYAQETDGTLLDSLIQAHRNYRMKYCVVFITELNDIEKLRKKYGLVFEHIIFLRYDSTGLDFSNLDVCDLGGVFGMVFHQRLLDESSRQQKRIIDLVLSGLMILLLSPFLILVAIAIILDSRGGAFFTQPRIGRNGKIFRMIKFRTMRQDADAYLAQYLKDNPDVSSEWDMYQKLHKDPRITKVGEFLRKTSLDELPQLFNVFLGQMSLVGPRPFMTDQVEAYGDAYNFYIRVLPGMTGLWQISGRNKTTFTRRTELDVRYVKTWSVWLDFYILLRTVWVVFTRDGAI